LLLLQRAAGNQAVGNILSAQVRRGAGPMCSPSLVLQRDIVKDPGQPNEVAIDQNLPGDLIDRIQPGMGREAVEAILREYRPPRVQYEIGAVFNASGRVKRVQKGTGGKDPGSATVNMTDLTSTLSPADKTNMVLTHNHPKGYPLSAGDAGQAAKHNMAEVRAIGFTTTSLRRKGDNWVNTADDPIAWLQVQSDFDGFRKAWPAACGRQLTQRKLNGKAVVVDTEIRMRDEKWLNLATSSDASVASPASFLDTYWACMKTAAKYNATFEDGLDNDLAAYAIKLLTELFNVEPEVARYAFGKK